MSKTKTITNGLDFEITGKSLMLYALPTLLSNIFMNIYAMVDAFFVANFISTDALSALNIVTPVMTIAMAISSMVAAGGSALCAKYLGERKDTRAKQTYSFLVLFTLTMSIIICSAAYVFRRPLLYLMGADDTLYALCEEYAVVILFILPFAMLGIIYQSFFVAAGKPNLSLGLSVAGGIINMLLDYVLIAVCGLGMSGAAAATGIGYAFQSVCATFYFLLKRDGLIYFGRPKWNTRDLLKTLSNGLSEMVSMLTSSVTLIAMNVILMRISGSDGVAAVTIILTVQMLLSSLYMGYLYGVAPITSYNYGKRDTDKLKKLFRVMLGTIAILSVITFLLAIIFARPLALIYASGSANVLAMSIRGIRILSPAFLAMGFNIMASSMFTALNDGKTSAIISFFRTFIFLMLPLLILPNILGVTGVWLSLPCAELLAVLLSAWYFYTKRNIYHYA